LFWYFNKKNRNIDCLKVEKEARLPVLLRGIFGFCANISAVNALRLISLAKATVIINSNPIIVAFLGYILLKERISIYDMVGIAVTFIGVVVFLMDSFGSNNDADFLTDLLGCISAFCCSIFASGAYLSIRKAGNGAHFLMLGF
jgi:drug/metabolite transporter (DMT)-like permease